MRELIMELSKCLSTYITSTIQLQAKTNLLSKPGNKTFASASEDVFKRLHLRKQKNFDKWKTSVGSDS